MVQSFDLVKRLLLLGMMDIWVVLCYGCAFSVLCSASCVRCSPIAKIRILTYQSMSLVPFVGDAFQEVRRKFLRCRKHRYRQAWVKAI